MKTLLFLLGVWAMLGLMQCKKDAAALPDQTIALQLQQRVWVSGAGAGVEVTLTRLTDSRCPTEAVCVWQGQANVEVSLRDATNRAQSVALCLGACRNDSAAVVLNTVPYWLRLTDVSPYPTLRVPPTGPSVATFRLTRQ